MLRDTYVEINLDNLEYNMGNIRRRANGAAIAAVIKADAYGHGAIAVADTLLSCGVEYLAVATLTEALELRKHNPKIDIFIMGYTPDENLEYIVRYNFTQALFSLHQARIIEGLGKARRKRPKVHIKYDTGFNRLGYRDCRESISEILEIARLNHVEIEGIFSHLALAGEEQDRKQFDKFIRAVDLLEGSGLRFRYRHICDSISAVDYPEFHLDMIRPGAMIYGLKSFRKNDIDLRQVMSFKTRIYHIKRIKAGEGVGYNYRWRAGRDSVIATLPVGYADGYPRNMSQKGVMSCGGVRVPVVGIICMDQCMIDVTEVPGVSSGDSVTIFGDGKSPSIEEVAEIADTNKNEIVSRITRRTPRIYIKNGRREFVKHYMDLEVKDGCA